MKGYKELKRVAREKFLADIKRTYGTFYKRIAAIEFLRETSNELRREAKEASK